MRTLNERGLTLTELAMVGAMGFLVMTAIMGFYMNCQVVWTDASSKSITQREVTGLSEHIAELVHQSSSAHVEPVLGDVTHCKLDLYKHGAILDTLWYSFEWNDGRILEGPPGEAPISSVTSSVEKFEFFPCATCNELVELTDLRLVSAEGRRVSLSTKMALYNR